MPLRKVLALGTIEDIRDAFGDNIKGSIERTPVAPEDLRYEDGAVLSLMRQALVRSVAESTGVRTDGLTTLWRTHAVRTARHDSASYSVHEAAVIFLRSIGSVQYLVLMPSLKVFDHTGAEPPPEIANPIKLEILGYQHNKPFNKAVNGWRETLFPDRRTAVFAFPSNSGSTFKFRVRRSPIFASIGMPAGGRALKVPDRLQPLIRHRGMQLDEPPLLFSNRMGTALVRDTHPIRGVLNNRPYDYPLTSRGFSSSLRIGVVCPTAEAQALHTYCQSIHQELAPSQTERDYLLDYPGFQTAYGLPAEVPAPDSAGWVTCPEPSKSDPIQGSLAVARLIGRSVETLQASYAPDVVLIYIPDRWQLFRGYRTDSESFDLHNFMKAFCVQRGIATQFLNQDTAVSGAVRQGHAHTVVAGQSCR